MVVVVSVFFPSEFTLDDVPVATSCVPDGVSTLTAVAVSFFTATSVFSPVAATLLPSAPFESVREISAAAFTSTGVLDTTLAPAAFSLTLIGTAVVVFPSTESTAAALTFTSPIFPSTARSTITGAEISTASIVPDASILIFPPSCVTETFAKDAPASTIILASTAVILIEFPFAFSR